MTCVFEDMVLGFAIIQIVFLSHIRHMYMARPNVC
jgi:hypothetical protein